MAAKPAIGGGEKWNLASFARQIAGIGQEIGCVLLKRSRPGVTPEDGALVATRSSLGQRSQRLSHRARQSLQAPLFAAVAVAGLSA